MQPPKSKSPFFHSTSASLDEELIHLQESLSKQHQFYDDLLSLILKVSDKAPIESRLFQDRRSFFHQSPKAQETLRTKFIGTSLKNLSFHNNFEAFLDDFYQRKEKLIFANKDPNELRKFLQKNLLKKTKTLEYLLPKLRLFMKETSEIHKEQREIRLNVSPHKSSGEKEPEFTDVLEELESEKTLLVKMETVTFVEKRNEDELVTEKHLYENFKQQMQDNFGFLSEKALETLVNDFSGALAMKRSLAGLRVAIRKSPIDLYFQYITGSEKAFFAATANDEFFLEKDVKVPLKLEGITQKLLNLAKELGLEEDIARDNGAFFLFSVEERYKKTYNEQARFLDFSTFKFMGDGFEKSDDFQLKKWDFGDKGVENEPLNVKLDAFGSNVAYLSTTDYVGFSTNTKGILQSKKLQTFEDSLVSSWMNCLLINDESESSNFIEKKSREYYDQHKTELYLPEVYFEFSKGFLKLLMLNSRKSLISIFSYINYMKHFERGLLLAQSNEIKTHKGQDSNNGSPKATKNRLRFNEKDWEFDDNDFLKVFADISASKQLVYDVSIPAFHREIAFLRQLASFSAHFAQKPIKLTQGSSQIDPPVFDNINRQELIDEILQLHAKFMKQKTLLLIKLGEMKSLTTNSIVFKQLSDFCMGIIHKTPNFPLFKDEIFRVYASEIKNMEILHELIRNIMEFQRKKEKRLWKIRENESALYKILRKTRKSGYFSLFAQETIKTLTSITASTEFLGHLFGDSICELTHSRISGVFYRRMLDLWQILSQQSEKKSEVLSEIQEVCLQTLEQDELLDNFTVFHEFFEMMKMGGNEMKTDSPRLRKSLQAPTLNIKDKLILGLNLMEFLRIREKIRVCVYSLGLEVQVFKRQQAVFVKDVVKIENIVGVNNVGNFLKGLVSLDVLKCSIDVGGFRNWVVFLVNQKKMDEPFLVLQYLFSIKSLLNQYILLNSLYYRRIALEFSTENERERKLAEASNEYFMDIFEKKKSVAFRVMQFKRVSVFTGPSSSGTDSKDSKILNKNINYNPFFSKGYKSQNAQTINDFTTILNKETYYEILKINGVLLRDQLELLNQRLPQKVKLFKPAPLKPLTPLKISVVPSKMAQKIQNEKERTKEKLDFPHNLLSLSILPSIESFLRFKTEEINSFSVNRPAPNEFRDRENTPKLNESRMDLKPNSTSGQRRRSSLMMTQSAPIEVFKRINRKKPIKNKEFEYLLESPCYLQICVLFHLLNVLGFELLRRLKEVTIPDLLYFLAGMMDESAYLRNSRENAGFEELKRNIVRVSSKMHFIRDELDTIERNIAFIHAKHLEKTGVLFAKEVLKYLKTLHKKEYNLLLASILLDCESNPASKAILQPFCFNKLAPGLSSIKIMAKDQQETSYNNNILYNELSPIMKALEDVFLFEKKRPPFTPELGLFFLRNNIQIFGMFDYFLLTLPFPTKQRLNSNSAEILKILALRLPEGVSPNSPESEFLNQKFLSMNIKVWVFRMMIKLASENRPDLDRKIAFLERMMEKEHKPRVLVEPERGTPLKLSRYLQEEAFIKRRLSFLSNELEKTLINEAVEFYLLRNQEFSMFINERNYSLAIEQESLNKQKEKTEGNAQPVNLILECFKGRCLSISCQINIFKVGNGFVIPIKRLKEDISMLNSSFLQHLSSIFDYFLRSLFQERNNLQRCGEIQAIRLQNLKEKKGFLVDSFAEIVESKIAKRSSDLLFSLDHLYKALNYMKDEEALREQEIKKITHNEFSERIVYKKNDINSIKSRFLDHKTGMSLDLRKYIEEAKIETGKMLQKRNAFRPSFLTRFTKIFHNLNESEEGQEKTEGTVSKYKDKTKLYKTFRLLRVFFVMRHQILKEKFARNLEEKNQKFISSEVLWNKIKDLEKSEARIKELLIDSEKEIAVLEHQNLVLKKDVRNITLEKVQLYKANNLQRGQILELEENFAVLKRKKFIDNPDTESMMKANTRPMSSVARKLLKQQTEFFALNNTETTPVEKNKKRGSLLKLRTASAKKVGITEFSRSGEMRQKGVFGNKKKKEFLEGNGLFVRKSFKVSSGSMTNLRFYANDQEKKL